MNEIKGKVQTLNACACRASWLGYGNRRVGWDTGTDAPTSWQRLGWCPNGPRRNCTIGSFVDGYIISRKDLKPQTQVNLQQVKRDLVLYFGGENKPMAGATEGDADDWRIWLAQTELKESGKLIKRESWGQTPSSGAGQYQLFRRR